MPDQTFTGKEETKKDAAVCLEMKGKWSQNYFKSRCHIFQFSNTSTQHQNKTNAEKKKTCTQNYTQFCVAATPPCGEEKGLVATFEF